MKRILLPFFFMAIAASAYAQSWTAGTNINNTNSGNVGIGTTSPAEKLHINGSIRGNQSGALRISTGFGYLDIGPKNSSFAHFDTDRTYGFYFGNNVSFNGALRSHTGTNFTFQSAIGVTYTTRMTILSSNGFVGINTVTPAYQLDVNGTINATAIKINGQSLGESQWVTSGPNLNYNASGVVSIGTLNSPSGYKLAVGGKIVSEEVVVKLQANWPDYVFERDYKLLSPEELQLFIATYKHLPGVPSAKDVLKDGISLGEMNAVLLKKIEELTIYMIKQQDEIEALIKKVNSL